MSRDREQKRQKRMRDFRALVQERVLQMNVSWVQMEQGVSDRDVADSLMRELHTLKGEAGLLGFTIVSDLAHALEDVVGTIIGSGSMPSPEVGDQILEGFDALVTLSEADPANPSVEGLHLIAQLQKLADEMTGAQTDGDPPPPAPPSPQQPAQKKSDNDHSAAQSDAHDTRRAETVELPRPPSSLPQSLLSGTPQFGTSLIDEPPEETSISIPIPIPSNSPQKAASYS